MSWVSDGEWVRVCEPKHGLGLGHGLGHANLDMD